jgi:hypothetical protein
VAVSGAAAQEKIAELNFAFGKLHASHWTISSDATTSDRVQSFWQKHWEGAATVKVSILLPSISMLRPAHSGFS